MDENKNKRIIIGVSGITELSVIQQLSREAELNDTYVFAGLLTSHSIIKGVVPQGRYLNASQMKALAKPMGRVSYIAHYCIGGKDAQREDFPICAALNIFGPTGCDGIQFNSAHWPHVNGLMATKKKEAFKDKIFILQINESLLMSVRYDPQLLAGKLAEYGSGIDFALLDESSGQGIVPDFMRTEKLLEAMHGISGIKIGLAGGLNSEAPAVVEKLIRKYDISLIDAEQKLMDQKERIDIYKAMSYIQRFSRAAQAQAVEE